MQRGCSAALSELEAEVPSKIGKGLGRRDEDEAGRLSSTRVRKLLGEQCKLNDTQIEELTDGLCALADFAVDAFVEQRKHRSIIASEQSIPMPAATARVSAVM